MDKKTIVLDAIKSRRTIRRYKNTKIPPKLIDDIMEAGRWAPSAHNLQPWKFIIISNEKLIKDIHTIMLKKEKELFAGFNIIMKETAKCLETCSVLIVVYSNGSVKNRFIKFGEPYISNGSLYEIQSVSFAISNMMLYASAAGVGSALLGVALFCEKEIKNLLKREGNLVALLSLGLPIEIGAEVKRKPISEIVEFL